VAPATALLFRVPPRRRASPSNHRAGSAEAGRSAAHARYFARVWLLDRRCVRERRHRPITWLTGNGIQKLRYSRLIAGLAALALVIGASWTALEYFVPSLPLRVTIATGRKGTTFDYFGERYRARFARAGVELNLRETAGALENLRLLREHLIHLTT
jgi:hypothetical protein